MIPLYVNKKFTQINEFLIDHLAEFEQPWIEDSNKEVILHYDIRNRGLYLAYIMQALIRAGDGLSLNDSFHVEFFCRFNIEVLVFMYIHRPMVNNFQDPIIFSTYIKLCMKENGFKEEMG